MKIKLEPINDQNREAVLALSVREDQPFVASNKTSLRQYEETEAEAPGVARPFAIYADDTLVGFCMFAFDPEAEDEDDRYWLWRFMIDKEHQGKGYGKEALKLALDFIRTWPCGEAKYCWLSYEPENKVAADLYSSFGFKETGEMDGDELIAVLNLGKEKP